MVTVTPDMAGNTLIVAGIVYVITIGYGIYMAMLNRKQAKVSDKIEETNKLLVNIHTELVKGKKK